MAPSCKAAVLATLTVASMVASWAAWGKDAAAQSQKAVLRIVDRDSSLFLRLPKADTITYQGVVSHDAGGMDSAQIVYPAADLVSFLAAVITHGVIVESVKKGKKSKLQEAADQVLTPYQEVLAGFRPAELLQRGLGKCFSRSRMKLVDVSEKPSGGWTIETAPAFAMTQDRSAIVLDNLILIYAADAPSGASYRNVVRVISKTRTESDLIDFWNADQGEKLKEESANLFAESLEMALAEVSGEPIENKNPYRTVRYYQGRTEKMERSQLVSENCERKVLKTLRGWLMSVPSMQPAGDPSTACPEPLKTTSQ
jgi:hypothetical protein